MEAGLLDVYLFVYGFFVSLIGAGIIMLINYAADKKQHS